MIGGVYAPGESKARLYLPTSGAAERGEIEGYVNVNAPYQHLPAGQWATIDAPWDTGSIPVLARIGAVIPVGKPVATACPNEDLEPRDEFPNLPADDYRGVEIFPPEGDSKGQAWKGVWYEDDGLSAEENWCSSRFVVEYGCTESEVTVSFTREGAFVPVWKDLSVILPVGDERKVVSKDGVEVERCGKDERGRVVYRLVL